MNDFTLAYTTSLGSYLCLLFKFCLSLDHLDALLWAASCDIVPSFVFCHPQFTIRVEDCTAKVLFNLFQVCIPIINWIAPCTTVAKVQEAQMALTTSILHTSPFNLGIVFRFGGRQVVCCGVWIES